MTLVPNTYKGRYVGHLLNASGYVYRNGYRTVGEFMGLFGFDPRSEPEFFKITVTGLVVAKESFSRLCDTHFNSVQENYDSIID